MSKKWVAGPSLKQGVGFPSIATDPNDGRLQISGGRKGDFYTGEDLDIIQILRNTANAEWEIDPLITLPRPTRE